eukprot:gene24433-29533_t
MLATQNNQEAKATTRSSKSHVSQDWIIPEIIEEKRKRSDGRIVCNRYATGKLLGKGGFAKVFIGTLLPSKHDYALKIVSKASLTKDRARLKLQSEIKIHKVLDHDNVVKFERCFEDNTYYYLLMELCTNQSMSSLLEQRKRITEVKVGDFGLAAKLTYETERKKTVCGTPNYIAPEILKSETGHSFEVDIWSTGVILYTLLVGKPPFQCKDVKTTYDKILSNVYTYPDHVLLSHEAKSLINRMLQHYPANRIGLNEILEDSFFTASHAFTPTSLPESSLRHCPHIEDLTPRSTLSIPASYTSTKALHHDDKAPAAFHQDENDPHALNRLRPTSSHQPVKPTHTALHVASGASAKSSGLGSHGAYAAPSRPKSAGPMQRRAFQIFDDVPRESAANPSPKSLLPSTLPAPPTATTTNSTTATTTPVNTASHFPPAPGSDSDRRATRSDRSTRSSAAVDGLMEVQQGLQQVQLEDKEPSQPVKRSREAWRESPPTKPSFAAEQGAMRLHTPPEATNKNNAEMRAPNTLEAVHDMLTSHTFANATTLTTAHSNTQVGHSQTVDLYGGLGGATGALGLGGRVGAHVSEKKRPLKVVPSVWVVRYVDYTSKYGLGFLLNTGSAGVNFNDSTKIVLSPDGKIFQYFERKKGTATGSSEHVAQRHYLDSYPPDLHKKVTLLKHFRNYLLEEEKNAGNNSSHKEENSEQQQLALRYAFSKDALAENKTSPMTEVAVGDRKGLEGEGDLPFVKKYIRTKHAILFRLSNHTVQMVFYDRSEILLTSEAKYITYVNKTGQRSDHYLEDTLLQERADISQRLKYTKDIMHRLITMA